MPREAFTHELAAACSCDKQPTCAEFFTGLDDKGKALFMLGGPVFGRSPEYGVDAAGTDEPTHYCHTPLLWAPVYDGLARALEMASEVAAAGLGL